MFRARAQTVRVTRGITTAVSRGYHSIAYILEQVWEAHRGQLMRNVAYAAAVAAAAADVVNQVELDRLVAAVLLAIVAIYFAIRHGQRAPAWEADEPTWR